MHRGGQALLLIIRTLPFLVLTQMSEFYPEQVKLAWTSQENEILVTWVTFLPSLSYVRSRPILCSIAGTESVIKGSSITFNSGSETVPKLQFIHSALISPVTEGCYYEYKVGNLIYWSKPYSFKGLTPNYSHSKQTPVSLIVLGDLGTGSFSKGTKDLLYMEADIRTYDAVIHLGDLAYDLDDNFGEVGDDFLRMIEPVAAKLPYMTVPGNHEKYHNFTHYKHRFRMPVNEANQGTGYFYSFDLGPVHFVLFNTELFLVKKYHQAFINQWNWLVADLKIASLNRDAVPWLIIGTHHPVYCSVDWLDAFPNIDCFDRANRLQLELEELLKTYEVDVFFQAHVHNYERTAPVYHNSTVKSDTDGPNLHVNPRAPIYITTGNAGNNHGFNDLVSRTPQEWSVSRSQTFGYGHLRVFNRTHLYWEQVKSMTMEVVDFVWVVKDDLMTY